MENRYGNLEVGKATDGSTFLAIKNYCTGKKLSDFNQITDSPKECVEKAVELGVSLSGADLRNLDLKGARLKGADLRYAHLEGADCKGADFSEANCINADFSNSCQTSTNFTKANISYSDLWCANFRHSNWTDTTCIGVRLAATRVSTLYLGEKYGSVMKCHNPIIQISPVGMYQEHMQVFRTNKGVFIRLGSFFDSMEEFKKKLILVKEHGNSIDEYNTILKMIEDLRAKDIETLEA